VQRLQAAAERAAREQARQEEIEELGRLIHSLTRVHWEEFQPPGPLVAPRLPPVSAADLLDDIEQAHLQGIGRFARAERKVARKAALAEAERSAAAKQLSQDEAWRATQADLDRVWEGLRTGDPTVVLDVLNAAYADNEARAACVHVQGTTALILMFQPDLDVIPTRHPDVTPGGKPTLRNLTKTQRLALWTGNTFSNVAATINETLAVAQCLSDVTIVVLRHTPGARHEFSPVLIAAFARAALTDIRWTRVDASEVLGRATQTELNLGRFHELKDLDVSADPDMTFLLDQLDDAWDTTLDLELAVDSLSAGTAGEKPDVGPPAPATPFLPGIETKADDDHRTAEVNALSAEAVPGPIRAAQLDVHSGAVDASARERPVSRSDDKEAADPPEASAGVVAHELPAHDWQTFQGFGGAAYVSATEIVIVHVDPSGQHITSHVQMPLSQVVEVHAYDAADYAPGVLQVVFRGSPRPLVTPWTAFLEPASLLFTVEQRPVFLPLIEWLTQVATTNS
jgi:hypothetical protein